MVHSGPQRVNAVSASVSKHCGTVTKRSDLDISQCDACKHRKVRCDKGAPCSNCKSSGNGMLIFHVFINGQN